MTCRSLAKPLLLPGLVLMLSACGQGGDSNPSCDYASENLLKDTGFTTLDEPRQTRAWSFSQHASKPSFEYTSHDGVLTFTNTGPEPWGLLTQSIETKGLKGKRVEYSAEIKLDLTEPDNEHGFGYGGGLSLLARQGNRVRLTSKLDHEPHIGKHDWQRVSVVADLPRGIDFIRLGILHQAGGSFQIRNPSLRKVAGGCEATVTEK